MEEKELIYTHTDGDANVIANVYCDLVDGMCTNGDLIIKRYEPKYKERLTVTGTIEQIDAIVLEEINNLPE